MSAASKRVDSWCVTVERNGETVVTISSIDLAGRDLSEADERAIELAALSLCGFIGLSTPVRLGEAQDESREE